MIKEAITIYDFKVSHWNFLIYVVSTIALITCVLDIYNSLRTSFASILNFFQFHVQTYDQSLLCQLKSNYMMFNCNSVGEVTHKTA